MEESVRCINLDQTEFYEIWNGAGWSILKSRNSIKYFVIKNDKLIDFYILDQSEFVFGIFGIYGNIVPEYIIKQIHHYTKIIKLLP